MPERGRGEVASEGEYREGERGSGSGAALSLMAREEENKRWERWIERGSPGGAARGKTGETERGLGLEPAGLRDGLGPNGPK